MRKLIADSGSTKTTWALVDQQSGQPRVVSLVTTMGLNPLYVTPAQIATALREALDELGVRGAGPDELHFFGSGCSGDRVGEVERALRSALTPMTRVRVESDLVGAAVALAGRGVSALPLAAVPSGSSRGAVGGQDAGAAFIACILGTGSIAALYDPLQHRLQPMPALGYILGDEGSGAWMGRHVLGDYLKGQMTAKVREAFEEDFGAITAESAIQHVYQQPCPNRYLAQFAAFLGRHQELSYAQQLAFAGLDLFWQRNVMRVRDVADGGEEVRDVRLVGSLAWALRPVVEQVAELHGYVVTQVLKDPIDGLI